MKRKVLKTLFNEVIEEYKQKPCEFWRKGEFPITFVRVFENKEVQFEIDLLENEEKYFHIGVSAGDGLLWSYFPVCSSFIVEKRN